MHRVGTLTIRDFGVRIGKRQIVTDASFSTLPGQVTVVVGHNGAGKTTLLKGIAGVLPSAGGEVNLDGVALGRKNAAYRARRGMALIPDGARGVFADMTVAENLALSTICARQSHSDQRLHSMTELVASLFSTVVVDRSQQVAGSLSGGQRQMLAIAVALSRGPSVLMLDEPSLGLAPVLVEQVLSGVREVVSRFDISCVLVEQNVGAAMQMADTMLVLKEGRFMASFASADLPSVQELWDLF